MNRTTKVHVTWVFAVASILITGCLSQKALKSDFGEYGKGYAESGDRQLLFNLARLANNDSVSFMQLVSISSEHQYSATLGYNQSDMHNSPGFYPSSTTAGSPSPTGSAVSAMQEYTKKAVTYGGTANAGIMDVPTFQFVPLSGSNIVNAVLTPIPSQTFYALYDQGYPADLLVRTMVESIAHRTTNTTNFTIEFKVPGHNDIAVTGCNTKYTNYTNIIVNFSADVRADLHEKYINDIKNELNCFSKSVLKDGDNVTVDLAAFHSAQKNDTDKKSEADKKGDSSNITATITAHVTTNYEYWVNNPYDESYPQFLEFSEKLRILQLKQALTVHQKVGAGTIIYSGSNPPLKDVVSATQSNLTVKFANGVCTVTKNAPMAYEFVINSNVLISISNAFDHIPFSSVFQYGLGGSLQIAATKLKDLRTNAFEYARNCDLKMKAVESAMFTAGKEETYFRKLSMHTVRTNIQFTADASGPFAWVLSPTQDNRETQAWRFSTNDIRALSSFAEKLSQKSDDVSRMLRSMMSCAIDKPLAEYRMKWADPESLQAVKAANTNKSLPDALVMELNDIITGTNALINNDAVKKLHLRPQTVALVKKDRTPEQDKLLKRMLLEDAYPEELWSPYFKVYPLMKLTCEDNETPFHHVLASIYYRKDDGTHKWYYVGDAKDQTQDRKVFTILTYLFESSAVSTQNLPVQQLIEVH